MSRRFSMRNVVTPLRVYEGVSTGLLPGFQPALKTRWSRDFVLMLRVS